MDIPTTFPERTDSPSSIYSSHSTPRSDCYSTSSASVGLGLSYGNPLPPPSTSAWSQDDFINLTATSPSAQYSLWSQGHCYDQAAPVSWSHSELFPTPVAHLQPSPAPQSGYIEPIPVLLSSSCTSVSSRCNTPSSFPNSPQPGVVMASPNRYPFLLPQEEAPMHYYGEAPQQDQEYDTHGHLYLYSMVGSPPIVAHDGADSKQRLLQEPGAESSSLTEHLNQDSEPSLTEKMQVMEERTKLVRVRQPQGWSTASANSHTSSTRSKNVKAPAPIPRCEICKRSFSRRHNLDQHNKRKHPEHGVERMKAFKCHERDCNREFDRMADLTRHYDSVSTWPFL